MSTPHSLEVSLPSLRQIEQQSLDEGREYARARLQQTLQAEADRLGRLHPLTGKRLRRARRVRMVLRTISGWVTLVVWQGLCPECGQPVCPARRHWGLAPVQRLSPELERRLCHTAAQTGSYEKASQLAEIWDCPVSDDAIHDVVSRKGQQAMDAPLQSPLPLPKRPFTLILMMDGWMARHRQLQWGCKPPHQKANRVQWHEIKSAVLFHLEDRGKTAGGRPVLVRKQVVAVPAHTEPVEFGRQVHREAVRMGLAQADNVYVIQDGAVYLWNIFEDRFATVARGQLDFYHASGHLWALANALHGEGTEAARLWAGGLLHQLRHGQEDRVIRTLEECLAAPRVEPAHPLLRTTTEYFQNHRDHIHYAEMDAYGVPLGSGAMESQCSQFQNRLKRRGQFWSKDGFACLLAIVVRVQNQELESLWAA